ncbi:MAG TPA: CHAT domain-containing tetratricopeptide repeat protein [Terriglobales bacterium]|jgi:CHAT domain-containing protein|nr:CHAT domain-containing tetratricopeptide repeat protein [Terriglobales bacterium]
MSVQAAQKTVADGMVERLLALDETAARVELVKQNPAVAWNEIVNTLTEKVWLEVRIDTKNAKRIADASLDVAQTLADSSLIARSLRAKANALYALDEHVEAVHFHEQAIALFEQTGEETELARTLSGSIQPLLLLGRYDQALASGERAGAIFQKQGNTRRLARVEINIGNIYHRQDRFSEALAFYERAYEQMLAHDDAEGLAAVLSNLSLCHISLNDFPKALELHRVARRHCEQKNMPILVAYADYNIAYLYFLRGEYGRSIQMLRDASVSAKNANDAYQLALCNLDLSEIYLELNLSAEAGELGRAANEAFNELGFGYEAAKALGFAAIAASRQGQAFEAVKLFARAKEMFVRDQNQVWPALLDLYEALVLFAEGRLFEARRLCAAAHTFFRTSSMRGKAVLAELLLARIAMRLADNDLAKEHCLTALKDLENLDSPTLLYQSEFLLGDVERAAGNENAAYDSYCRARAAVERLRSSLRGEELKIAFFENKLEVYESLVDICLRRQNSLEEAFAYIEQAKSRTLIDLLNQPVHVATTADPGQSELVRSIRNLREELNWYYNLIEREQLRPEERSPERVQHLEQQARSRESDLMRAMKEATVAEANEAGLQVPTSMSLDEIRAVLPADTALVEYFCTHGRNIACVVTRDKLQICPVTVQSRIQKLLQLLQFQMDKFRLDPQYVATFSDALLASTEAHLKSLYQELVAPIRHLLDAQHLVFVQHGLLHYVPFHALHDGQSYLIDRFAISYAPSASIYAHCLTKEAVTTGDSLILGIPDDRTPAISAEVNSLAMMLPHSRLFLGEDASEAVLRTYGPQSKSIHIATHGYFRQDNPMFSSIRLGTSHLSLYDMAHLQLPVDLVVLSGCATGLNVVTPGDELMGLVRGLLQAGARSLVLSLWDVHDDSTKEFMIEFYSRLQLGVSKAEAMQSACVNLRERRPHPYHWAPFLLIGKG